MGKIIKHRHQPSTLHGHVRELLMRLFAIGLVLLFTSVIFYIFYEPVLAFLSSPLNAPLYYSNPAGGFTFVMKICLMGALIFTIPVIIYSIIMFIRPAFSKVVSMKKIFFTTGASTLLALSGAAFAFYVIVPESLSFFEGYQVSGLNALISADSYLNFITGMITMFALIFQIPLIITFIDHIKPINTGKLLRADKWVILGSLIITVLQPFTYDLLTSLLMAFSIIAIYNLSIVTVAIQHGHERQKSLSLARAIRDNPVFVSDLVLDDQIIDSWAFELASLERPVLVQRTVITKRVSMDIKQTVAVNLNDVVKPAAWVEERKLRRLTIAKSSRTFSDFISVPRISPASA